MLAVVSQPRINDNFRIEGEISPASLEWLIERFGDSLRIEDSDAEAGERDEGSVDYRETEWYKEMSKDMTPAFNMGFYRKLHKLSQKQLASKLGVSVQYVSDMECERRGISKEMARRLADIFEVPVGRFI